MLIGIHLNSECIHVCSTPQLHLLLPNYGDETLALGRAVQIRAKPLINSRPSAHVLNPLLVGILQAPGHSSLDQARESTSKINPAIYNHGRSSGRTLGDRRSCIDWRPSWSRRIHGFPTNNATERHLQTNRYSTRRPHKVSLQQSDWYGTLAQSLQSISREVETQFDCCRRQSLHLWWRD